MARLKEYGVSTGLSTIEPGVGTGIAIIGVDAQGQNAISVVSGANMRIGESDIEALLPALASAKLLMLQLEIPVAASWPRRGRRARSASRSFSIRRPLLGAACQESFTASSTSSRRTRRRREFLLGYEPKSLEEAARAAHELVARGAKAAILTLGARGAYVVGEGGEALVPAFTVTPVSTVAAGDCFNAGLAVALAEGRPLIEAARFASACGALSTTKVGSAASAPTREEVERLLRA